MEWQLVFNLKSAKLLFSFERRQVLAAFKGCQSNHESNCWCNCNSPIRVSPTYRFSQSVAAILFSIQDDVKGISPLPGALISARVPLVWYGECSVCVLA